MTAATAGEATGVGDAPIEILSVSYSHTLRCDAVTIAIGDRRYELPLAEDLHAPVSGSGSASSAVWWVDDALTSVEDDEEIGCRYEEVGELLTEWMSERSAA